MICDIKCAPFSHNKVGIEGNVTLPIFTLMFLNLSTFGDDIDDFCGDGDDFGGGGDDFGGGGESF